MYANVIFVRHVSFYIARFEALPEGTSDNLPPSFFIFRVRIKLSYLIDVQDRGLY